MFFFYYFRTLIEEKKIAVSLSPSIKLSAYKYNKLAEVRKVEAEVTGLLIIIISRCSGRGRHGFGMFSQKGPMHKIAFKKAKQNKTKNNKKSSDIHWNVLPEVCSFTIQEDLSFLKDANNSSSQFRISGLMETYYVIFILLYRTSCMETFHVFFPFRFVYLPFKAAVCRI